MSMSTIVFTESTHWAIFLYIVYLTYTSFNISEWTFVHTAQSILKINYSFNTKIVTLPVYCKKNTVHSDAGGKVLWYSA